VSKTLPFSRILQSKRNEKRPSTPPSPSLFLSLSFLVVYSLVTPLSTSEFATAFGAIRLGLIRVSFLPLSLYLSRRVPCGMVRVCCWWEHQTPERFRHNRMIVAPMKSPLQDVID